MAFNPAQIKRIGEVKAKIKLKFEQLHQQVWFKELPFEARQSLYLAGGAIASLLQDETPNDWDLYFNHSYACAQFVKHIENLKPWIKDVDEKYRETVGVDGKMITEKAVTMKDSTSFIIMHSGKPAAIKQTFDYLHTTMHYDASTDKLYVSEAQYDAAVFKKLVVANALEVTPLRTGKFIDRGYKKC